VGLDRNRGHLALSVVRGVFGPDIVSTNGAQTTTVPSAVIVALFALLATWVLARRAFRDGRS
jgi:hypothetical protein